jgi:hypothetical protein
MKDPAAESELMFTHLCCVFRWATTVAGYRNPDSPSGRPERSRLSHALTVGSAAYLLGWQ